MPPIDPSKSNVREFPKNRFVGNNLFNNRRGGFWNEQNTPVINNNGREDFRYSIGATQIQLLEFTGQTEDGNGDIMVAPEQVVFGSTSGGLTQSATFFFDNTILTSPDLRSSNNAFPAEPGRVYFADATGKLMTDSGFYYDPVGNTLYVNNIEVGAGDADFTYDDTTNTLTAPNIKPTNGVMQQVFFGGANGQLVQDTGFFYDATTNQLFVDNKEVITGIDIFDDSGTIKLDATSIDFGTALDVVQDPIRPNGVKVNGIAPGATQGVRSNEVAFFGAGPQFLLTQEPEFAYDPTTNVLSARFIKPNEPGTGVRQQLYFGRNVVGATEGALDQDARLFYDDVLNELRLAGRFIYDTQTNSDPNYWFWDLFDKIGGINVKSNDANAFIIGNGGFNDNYDTATGTITSTFKRVFSALSTFADAVATRLRVNNVIEYGGIGLIHDSRDTIAVQDLRPNDPFAHTIGTFEYNEVFDTTNGVVSATTQRNNSTELATATAHTSTSTVVFIDTASATTSVTFPLGNRFTLINRKATEITTPTYLTPTATSTSVVANSVTTFQKIGVNWYLISNLI